MNQEQVNQRTVSEENDVLRTENIESSKNRARTMMLRRAQGGLLHNQYQHQLGEEAAEITEDEDTDWDDSIVHSDIERAHPNKDIIMINHNNPQTTISSLAKTLERNPSTSWSTLMDCIRRHPKELGFSVLLATMRFNIPCSDKSMRQTLMSHLFQAIDEFYDHYIQYIITNNNNNHEYIPAIAVDNTHNDLEGRPAVVALSPSKKPPSSSPTIVVGEALILFWEMRNSHFVSDHENDHEKHHDDGTQSNIVMMNNNEKGLDIFKMIFQRYPRSILYHDRGLSPIHELCCYRPFNLDLFQLFIEQHIEMDPLGRAGLYHKEDNEDQIPLEALFENHNEDDTCTTLSPVLQYLRDYRHHSHHHLPLLGPHDITDHNLFHRAVGDFDSSLETVKFVLALNPDAILKRDCCGESPLDHFYFSQIASEGLQFQETKKLEVLKLMIISGVNYEERTVVGKRKHETVGGLLSSVDPFLSLFIDKWGTETTLMLEAVSWIKLCLKDFKYREAPIVHAAIGKVKHEHLKCIIETFGASMRNSHGQLPLHYAIERGLTWSSGVKDIFAAYPRAVMEKQKSIGLPLFAQAAIGNGSNLETIFNLLLESPSGMLFDTTSSSQSANIKRRSVHVIDTSKQRHKRNKISS